jgi:multidrug efflux pump subunit AcrA (membrane-fusion protein)
MEKNKRIFAIFSLVVLLALVLAGCSGTANAQTGSTSNNFTGYGTVNQVSYTNTVESTGQIQPQHIASLAFTTTGKIAQSDASVGQTVSAGQTLMTLDPSSVPSNLITSQTNLTNAQNALNQLTNPELSTVSNAQKALSAAYNTYQQAQATLSSAIFANQTASDKANYSNWLATKTDLVSAQNSLPLANAPITVQEYFQAVRDTSTLLDELTAAQTNASLHPDDATLAQKVSDLQAALQANQTLQNNLQANVDSTTAGLVIALSDKLSAYDTATNNFISTVTTATTTTNVSAAQIQADLATKQSSLLSDQTTLQNQINTRAGMNGTRCDVSTITNYQDIYNSAVQRYARSSHIIDSPEYRAMQTAEANLNYCDTSWTDAEKAAADANIASTQAQIALLQTQIATDQSQLSDSTSSVYILAIQLNNDWTAYQDATQQLNNSVNALYQLEVSPNPNDLAAAQANVLAAQASVNSLNLTAPFTGEVTSIGYQPGDTVSQSTPAIVIVDRSSLYVDLQIDESHVVNLSVGNKATISLEANPNLPLTGKVTYINPVGTSTQGVVYYDVRVTLDKADASILIGATADVTIQAGQAQAVLTVPVSAVGNGTSGEYVYVVNSDGSTQQVPVVSGQILSNNTVIVSGNLKAGQSVGLLPSTSTGTNSNSGGFGGGGGGTRILP